MAAPRKRKKIGANQFARNQLKKAGITPVANSGVRAQFRKANRNAAAIRTALSLGTKGKSSSALAAGTRQGPKRKKIGADQFARNQLKKAGITPTATGDVKAQFRALNKKAVKRRAAAGLGRARDVKASSALAAGNRRGVPNRPFIKAKAVTRALNRANKAGAGTAAMAAGARGASTSRQLTSSKRKRRRAPRVGKAI